MKHTAFSLAQFFSEYCFILLMALMIVAIYLIIERSAFFLRWRAAPSPNFFNLLAHLKLSWERDWVRVDDMGSTYFGWMQLYARTPQDWLESVDFLKKRTLQSVSALGHLANAATSIGLLGTVCSLILAPQGNPTEVIAVGLGTTFMGLCISIPLQYMACPFFQRRQLELLEQLEEIETLLQLRIPECLLAPCETQTAYELQ